MDTDRDEGVDDEGGGEAEASEAEEQLLAALRAVADATGGIEPAAGEVTRAELQPIRDRLLQLAGPLDAAPDATELRSAAATLYARGAALAIAAGDAALACDWLREAERLSAGEQQRAEVVAARDQLERFRGLAHGRALFANGKERAARKIWKQLAKAAADPIAKSAAAELAAPRPLGDRSPSLWSFYGCGVGFAGHRDEWDDGSYATTHCVTLLFVPLIPLAAYRVAPADEGYLVLAREQLSEFARAMRYAVVGLIAVTIAVVAINSYVNDPARLARKRFDHALEVAANAEPEAAIRELDGVLAGGDLQRVGPDRARRAGAEIIRLTAGMAPKPFRRDRVDHGQRLVQRYKGLPPEVQPGPAQDAVVRALVDWTKQLGAGPETAEARLALLQLAADVADGSRAGALQAQIATTRLAVADGKAADRPLDALAVLVQQLDAAALDRATKIVARLVEAPSLLVEAGADLDRWLAIVSPNDPLHRAVTSQREVAAAGRKEAEAEGVRPAQLAAMEKQRPWDQYVQLRLARAEIDAGKLDAAAARVGKLGPPGLIVREGRLVLAQLSSALGKLEVADALLTGLLEGRLERYVAASGALQQAVKAAYTRVENDLRIGNVPQAMQQKYEATTGDDARGAVVRAWADETVAQDRGVTAAREAYLTLTDVVQVSLVAGTVKLRRAQAMSGAARDAMLGLAERTFLAIRTEAEGQPEFRLGLGEIYARLGKTKESEAEFAAVLAKNEPMLSLRVAYVYRNLGSVERARQVATAVHDAKPEPRSASDAAELLGLLESNRDDDASERWYRKADQTAPRVRAALVLIEGRRLLRQGKLAECAARFATLARMHLDDPNPNYNDAALAHSLRYYCSGDLAVLSEVETTLEKAYRTQPENPIIVGNLAASLGQHANLRAIGTQLDVRALRLDLDEAGTVIGSLRDSPERTSVLAARAADRGAQRAAELLVQYEVLAPNSTSSYELAFQLAHLRRDEAAAAAILERARRAKGIDTSEAAHVRKERANSAADAKLLEHVATTLARHDESLARRLDPRTRAAALMLAGTKRVFLGLYKADRALLVRARDQLLEAMKLWPAIDATHVVLGALIDEAGVAADAPGWLRLRRERSAVATLAKLVADGAPLAAAIRGSKAWSEIAGHARADVSRPGVDDLRLARLLGDAALESRARAVLDNKIARLARELEVLFDPGNLAAAEDLAYLGKR